MRRRRNRRTILDHWNKCNMCMCICVHLINTRIDLLHSILASFFNLFVLSFQLIYELNMYTQHTSHITILMHIAQHTEKYCLFLLFRKMYVKIGIFFQPSPPHWFVEKFWNSKTFPHKYYVTLENFQISLSLVHLISCVCAFFWQTISFNF